MKTTPAKTCLALGQVSTSYYRTDFKYFCWCGRWGVRIEQTFKSIIFLEEHKQITQIFKMPSTKNKMAF